MGIKRGIKKTSAQVSVGGNIVDRLVIAIGTTETKDIGSLIPSLSAALAENVDVTVIVPAAFPIDLRYVA